MLALLACSGVLCGELVNLAKGGDGVHTLAYPRGTYKSPQEHDSQGPGSLNGFCDVLLTSPKMQEKQERELSALKIISEQATHC